MCVNQATVVVSGTSFTSCTASDVSEPNQFPPPICCLLLPSAPPRRHELSCTRLGAARAPAAPGRRQNRSAAVAGSGLARSTRSGWRGVGGRAALPLCPRLVHFAVAHPQLSIQIALDRLESGPSLAEERGRGLKTKNLFSISRFEIFIHIFQLSSERMLLCSMECCFLLYNF